MTELALSDIRLRFGNKEALKGVSLTADDGKVVVLLGPSGSGKSALLRAIAGLERPQAGSIRIGGEVVFDAGRRVSVPAHKRGVGLLFQTDALWPDWSVFENVDYCARLGNADGRDVKTRALHALERAAAYDLALRKPVELSASERRRVTLARAIVNEPRVLLLDDPLSQLDRTPRAEAHAWLRKLATGSGAAVLIATRDPIEAMALADRIVLLNAGAVEQAGTPADLYREPTSLFAAGFMAQSNLLEGTLVENAATRAFIDVMGSRIGGVTQTRAALGSKAYGVIRVERTLVGGGPGANRLPMKLTSQLYLGERWELVFVREGLSVRAYTSAPLRHEQYHVEFPPEALWIF